MTYFSYLLQLGILITVFDFLWKIIFLGFAFAAILWRPFIYVGKTLCYYLLVSMIGLITLVYINEASTVWAWIAFFTGLFVCFLVIGGGMAESQKQVAQTGDYEALDMLKYDGVFFFASLIFYVIVLFFPVVSLNPVISLLSYVVGWIADLPIIGLLVSLYGGYTVLGMMFSGVLMGLMAVVLPAAHVYKKLGIAEKRSKENAYELFDTAFPKWKDKFNLQEKKLFRHIYDCLATDKILPDDSYDPIFHFPGVGNLFFKTKLFRRGKIYLNINTHKGIVITPESTKRIIKDFLRTYGIAKDQPALTAPPSSAAA